MRVFVFLFIANFNCKNCKCKTLNFRKLLLATVKEVSGER